MGRIPVVLYFLCLIPVCVLYARPDEAYFESDQLNSLPILPAETEPAAKKKKPAARPPTTEPARLPPFGKDAASLRRLLGRARAKRLSKTVLWRRMLHYRPRAFGGYESEADGEKFFLSPEGKTNPAAELDANLRAFTRPLLEGGGDLRCIFPLRYKWLRRELGSPAELPRVNCPQVRRYLNKIKADSASLVFASYYLNSPASMFGHTLIKLNSKERGGMELLDYVINYSARVGRTNTASYIWKGVFGGYPGHFTTEPYHVKVREYNDVESRDIHEYRLNLTPEEIENMLLHTVELEQTHFDYYYFDENCSYHLLSLLEIARPRANLTERFGAWVLPKETIQSVMESRGLVAKVLYRPSLHSEIRGGLHGLSPAEREIFYGLMDGDLRPDGKEFRGLGDTRQAHVADVALKALRFRKSTGDSTPAQNRLLNSLLVTRARLPVQTSPAGRPPLQFSAPPHLGHDPARVALTGGDSSFGAFNEIALRPGLQDLLNNHTGYAPNSELVIGDLRVRQYSESSRVELEKLTLFQVSSLPRFESLAPSVSYTIDSGVRADLIERPGLDPLIEVLALQSLAAGGFSFRDFYLYRTFLDESAAPASEKYDRIFPGYLDIQSGLTFENEYSPTWRDLRFSVLAGVRGEHAPGQNASSRLGPALTLLTTYGRGAWKFNLAASAYGYSAGGDPDSYQVKAGLSYALSTNSEIRLQAATRPHWNEAGLSFAFFF